MDPKTRRSARCSFNEAVSLHTLRHSFATRLLETGSDIRTVQELQGDKEVSATMIDTRVPNRPGMAVRSPAESNAGQADLI